MNKKAEKFKGFIEKNNYQDSFIVTEHQSEGREFVIFDTSVEVKGQYLKLVVILETGIECIIRVWIGQNLLTQENRIHVLKKLNELNNSYRIFKFFADEKGNIIMDWVNSSLDDVFDPNLIHFTLGVINREIANIYNQVMKTVWS